MAKLTFDEMEVLARVLSLKSGYVLDFSNQMCADLVEDCDRHRNVFGEHEKHGTSKAKILRGIIESEKDSTVAKLIHVLLAREKRFPVMSDDPPVTSDDRESARSVALSLEESCTHRSRR